MLSLGDLAYADRSSWPCWKVIMVGGYLKQTERKCATYSDAESNILIKIIAVQNGTITIKDANNRAVITSDGLGSCTFLHHQASLAVGRNAAYGTNGIQYIKGLALSTCIYPVT